MSFHSSRLSYRVFESKDEALYHQLTMNDELMKYINGKAHPESESKERFQKLLKINTAADDSEVYAVFHRETKAYVGLAKFVFTEKGQAEIGYVLHKAFWRQGYGTEISQRMVQLADVKKEAKELIALIDPENIGSEKILKKCGFVLKEMGTWRGLPCATYHLTVDKQEKPNQK